MSIVQVTSIQSRLRKREKISVTPFSWRPLLAQLAASRSAGSELPGTEGGYGDTSDNHNSPESLKNELEYPC